jgi:geranylgeranyl pyrophosphate synthase
VYFLEGIVDLRTINDPTENLQMDQGNKLAVLCGDYLLASACNNLAKLQNTQVRLNEFYRLQAFAVFNRLVLRI